MVLYESIIHGAVRASQCGKRRQPAEGRGGDAQGSVINPGRNGKVCAMQDKEKMDFERIR